MNHVTKFAYWIYGVGILILLFCSYPYALVPPGLSSNSYYLQLPTLFILSILSLVIIVCTQYRMSRSVSICIIVYCTFIVLNLIIKSNHLKECVEFLGYFTIPFAFSLYLQSKAKTIYIICIPATLLFSLLLAYGFINYLLGQEIIGITGNRNWMATALISLCPWSMYLLHRLIIRFVKHDRFSQLIPIAIILPPTLFLAYHCHSRAAWLSLTIFIFLVVIYKIKTLMIKIVLCMSVIGSCALFTIFYSNLIINAFLNDIRIPTWVSTIKLIYNSPWTGAGAGNYVKAHTPYRAKSEYHRRKVATNLTTHPHNELLNIGANLGIIAALAWLIMLFPLFMNWHNYSTINRLSQFTAFMIFGHSMLDKTLIQNPTTIIGLCSLGTLWIPYIRRDSHQPTRLTNPLFRGLTYIFILLLLITLTHLTVRQIQVGWFMRQAVIFKSGNDYDHAYASYKKMAEIDPNNIKGHYGAGTLAVQKLLLPNTAIPHLLNARKIDPNYAHLNSVLGKAYGTINNHRRASDYFERECRLFPVDINAFQNYFLALYKSGNYDALPAVSDYLNILYKKNVGGRQLSQDEGIKYTKLWLQALRNSDSKTAIDYANKLTSSIPVRFVDPLFSQIEAYSKLDPEFLYDNFNLHDFDYWREIFIRRDLVKDMRLNQMIQDNEISTLNIILEYTLKNRRIIKSTDPNLIYPSEFDQLNQLNIKLFYATLSWIGEELGMQMFLYQTNRYLGDHFIYIKGSKDWSRIEFIGAPDDLKYIIKHIGNKVLDFQPSSSTGSVKVFIIPQSFLLKNQILAIRLNQYLNGDALNFDKIPTTKLIALSQFLHAHGSDFSLSGLPFRFPFNNFSNHQAIK